MGGIYEPSPPYSGGVLGGTVQQQPAPSGIYGAMTSGADWLMDKIGPAIPPELRDKVMGIGELINAFNPATSYREYNSAMQDGRYGGAALSAAGLLPAMRLGGPITQAVKNVRVPALSERVADPVGDMALREIAAAMGELRAANVAPQTIGVRVPFGHWNYSRGARDYNVMRDSLPDWPHYGAPSNVNRLGHVPFRRND